MLQELIRTKSIYDAKEELDGIRVLVTRFWPRGIRKEYVSIMISALAPSKQLLLRYKRHAIVWEVLASEYTIQIARDEKAKDEIERLRLLSKENNITLLCYEREGENCHRHVLKNLIEKPGFHH